MPIDTARYACQSDPDYNTQFRRGWPDLCSLARRLDREADAELQQGRHRRAEYLARQAFDLREAAR